MIKQNEIFISDFQTKNSIAVKMTISMWKL